MNRTTKTFVVFAMAATMAGSALFAAPKPKHGRPAIERDVRNRDAEFQTLIGKVKESKWGYLIIETDEGNRYVINTVKAPGAVEFKEIKARAGNRLVLSGKLNSDSKVIDVIRIGFMESSETGDAK